MAQFISYIDGVEVKKNVIQSVIQGKEDRIQLLKNNGIDLNSGKWFDLQKWLNTFKEISTTLNDDELFTLGESTIIDSILPPLLGVKDGLTSLNVGYHLSHKLDGKKMFNILKGPKGVREGIGNVKVIDFDSKNKTAIVTSDTPQPSKFEEGVISQIIKHFGPSDIEPIVKLDLTKESRNDGFESCTFLISW